jgi:hypothetical protein
VIPRAPDGCRDKPFFWLINPIFEWWSWDGDIEADSVIFCSEDVAGLSEDDLKTLVRKHFKFDKDGFIFNRGPQYTLLNFNFR